MASVSYTTGCRTETYWIVKADRQEPLVVVRLSIAAALVAQIGTETKQ
jgi:hypothetical protein